MAGAAQRSVEIYLPGPCDLGCAVCDCRTQPTPDSRVARDLAGGGIRLTLRGGTANLRLVESLLGRARDGGFSEVAVRMSAHAIPNVEAAHALARQGMDVAIIPLFSHVAPVHDRIASRPQALVKTLVGMRALAEAGIGIEIETPLLPARLQKLEDLIDLARRAVPTLKSVRFYLPPLAQPPPLAPPPWKEGAPLLVGALTHAQSLGLKTALRRVDLVPLCALRDFPAQQTVFRFNPRKTESTTPGADTGEVCEKCAVRGQCPGIAKSYREAHGESDLHPYTRRPEAMYEQRTTPSRRWDESQRKAARESRMLVLRPTVNCNQDCTFCSANETSNNVWTDRELMLRQIARAARRGVTWLSFSGGEPTLSKDLTAFVRAAKRLGIRYIELVTNGVLLDSKPKVQALVEAGLSRAFVSMHAHTEDLSRHLTQKVGDFERTATAIGLLVDAGVWVTLNHVISARNYRYLEKFIEVVHQRFRGKVDISFAFVTPQYKALENIELVPRISDVWPHLRAALHRAIALEQTFTVGARQGIPPCFLHEFQGFSDIRIRTFELLGEDAPQKVRGPRCDECAYGDLCPGLWKPYAARYGLDELVPVLGRERVKPDIDQPIRRTFESIPDAQRDLHGEEHGLQDARAAIAAQALAEPEGFRLPAFAPTRSRPLRLAMLGTGRQARRLARALKNVRGLSLDAVASPHAPADSGPELGHCPSWRDAAQALAEMRPDAAIVAAATHAHAELARLCLAASVPVLVEKPFTRTIEEAEELARLAVEKRALLVPAHQVLFSEGLERFFELTGRRRVAYARHLPPSAPDVPRLWSAAALSQTLYHALILVSRAMGGGSAQVLEAHPIGDAAPERLRLRLAFAEGEADLSFDFSASGDSLSLSSTPADGHDLVWRRREREVTLTAGGVAVPVERRGSDIEQMLEAFRLAVTGEAPAPSTPDEALGVMAATDACVEALGQAGAPFERPNAPRHVASRAIAEPRRAGR